MASARPDLHAGASAGAPSATAAGPRAGWSPRRLLLLGAGLLVLAALVVRVIALVDAGFAEGDDFTPYWNGARSVAAGQNPYGWLAEGRPQEVPDYIYPPLLALLLAPLTLALDYPTARWLWLAFSALCLCVGLAVVWRTAGVQAARPTALVPLVVLLPAATSALGAGTLSPQLLLVVAGAFAAVRAGQNGAAGALIAMGAYLKSFPGLLGGYFLLRRQWRGCVAAVAAGLALVALSVGVLGWQAHWDYLTGVVPAQRRWFPMPLNVSLNGFFARLFADNEFAVPIVALGPLAPVITALAIAALLAATAYAVWRARADWPGQAAAFGLTVVAMLLVSPINGQYNFVIAALPLAVAIARVQAAWPRHLRWLLLIALLLSLPVEPCDLAPLRDMCLDPSGAVPVKDLPWRQGWGNLLLAGPFFGLLGLWALLWRLCLEPAQSTSDPPARP